MLCYACFGLAIRTHSSFNFFCFLLLSKSERVDTGAKCPIKIDRLHSQQREGNLGWPSETQL
jgi:hypothetical protein